MNKATTYLLLFLWLLRADVTIRVRGYVCSVHYYTDALIVLFLSCFQNLSMPLLTTHHVSTSLNHC